MTETLPKADVPPSYAKENTPISVPSTAVDILAWFDEETIIYLEESEQVSTLYTFNFGTGEKNVFFEYEGWIIDVEPNVNFDLFAIQLIDPFNQGKLYVLDREGQTALKIDNVGESYSVYWNYYEPEQFLFVAYLPEWQYELYLAHASEQSITPIEPVQSYLQWISSTNAAFLKWSELEPSYYAPLYELEIETGHVTKRQDEVIAFMSFPHHLYVTVTVSSVYDLHSIYTFYKNGTPIHRLEMPILNTYSEQWWTPFYTFDSKNEIFYFLRPKYSADYIHYEDGFYLVAFDTRSGEEETLTEIMMHEPIHISPNGESILIGNRFDRLFHIDSKEMYTILQDED